MFNLFKKKSPIDKLQAEHDKLVKEAYDLSKSDRKASDQKTYEAGEIMKKIEALEKA